MLLQTLSFSAIPVGLLRNSHQRLIGFTVTRTVQSNDADSKVPDSLRPIGNTFNVFKDAEPSKSTVNFVLNTNRAGHKDKAGQHASPGNFNTNWIGPNENTRAKMIYSSGAFLEDLILAPFYKTYAAAFQAQIEGLGADNAYEAAKFYNKGTPRTFSYALQHSDDGHDNQYWNSYNVSWKPLPGSNGISLEWSGSWHLRRRRDVNIGVDTASAWAQVESDWTATMTIEAALDDQKRSILKTSKLQINTSPLRTDGWRNDWAKVMKVFADIVGELGNIFTAFQKGDFVEKLSDSWGGSGPSLDTVDFTTMKLEDCINTAFILPAGDVFSFKVLLCQMFAKTKLIIPRIFRCSTLAKVACSLPTKPKQAAQL